MNKDTLSSFEISQHLSENYKNTKINIFDSVDSTNNIAKILAAQGASHHTIIVANEQTNGRGRQGKNFFSPANNGIYMSIILRPGEIENKNALYTVCAAVAVCNAIEKLTDKTPQIKWVNDIFLNTRKVCGILCEAVTGSSEGNIQAIIAGIGVNLRTEEQQFPSELKNIASSLFTENITRNELIAEIANNIFTLTDVADNTKTISEYRRRCFVLGHEVSYKINSVDYIGTAIDVNEFGNLIVKSGDETIILNSGEISCKLL